MLVGACRVCWPARDPCLSDMRRGDSGPNNVLVTSVASGSLPSANSATSNSHTESTALLADARTVRVASS